MPGWASSSKADRRRPSRLMSSPCRAASLGVSVRASSSFRPSSRARHLRANAARALGPDAAEIQAHAGEALVGVVGPQAQPVLGARGEHAVGLRHAAGDEVVDHHAEVAVGAGDDEPARGARRRQRRVDAGRNALRARLLVARGAVDLAGQEQPRLLFRLQRRQQLARVDVVVLDGIAEALDDHPLEPRNGAQERLLHFGRQRGGNAVGIDGVVVEALGLEEDLVPGPAREPHHLVLDRGAIARADAVDLARVHRCPVQVGADDGVRGLRRGGDAAFDLRVGDPLREEREGHGRVVAGLHLHAGPVDGARREPRRRAGLQPAEPQIECQQALGEPVRRGLAVAARRGLLLAAVDQPAQERARGQHHGARADTAAVGGDDPVHPAVLDRQVLDRRLDHLEVRRRADRGLHCGPIELAVGLGARALHGRPLGAVEQAELDAGGVRHAPHQAVERIDLAHEMALAEPADGRVAGHLADGGEAVRDQRRARAHAGGRRGGLAAGMAAADHNDVVARIRHGCARKSRQTGHNLAKASPDVKSASRRQAAMRPGRGHCGKQGHTVHIPGGHQPPRFRLALPVRSSTRWQIGAFGCTRRTLPNTSKS